jgi:hypothetical protein
MQILAGLGCRIGRLADWSNENRLPQHPGGHDVRSGDPEVLRTIGQSGTVRMPERRMVLLRA